MGNTNSSDQSSDETSVPAPMGLPDQPLPVLDDPRSPSTAINRTPIVCTDQHQYGMETPTRFTARQTCGNNGGPLVNDPRSPAMGFDRTPIMPGPSSGVGYVHTPIMPGPLSGVGNVRTPMPGPLVNDPRSPAMGFDRTPIMPGPSSGVGYVHTPIMPGPLSGVGNVRTPMPGPLVNDPRSPAMGFDRTPIMPGPSSGVGYVHTPIMPGPLAGVGYVPTPMPGPSVPTQLPLTNDTPVLKRMIYDPRSPTDGIPRTPMITDPSSIPETLMVSDHASTTRAPCTPPPSCTEPTVCGQTASPVEPTSIEQELVADEQELVAGAYKLNLDSSTAEQTVDKSSVVENQENAASTPSSSKYKRSERVFLGNVLTPDTSSAKQGKESATKQRGRPLGNITNSPASNPSSPALVTKYRHGALASRTAGSKVNAMDSPKIMVQHRQRTLVMNQNRQQNFTETIGGKEN